MADLFTQSVFKWSEINYSFPFVSAISQSWKQADRLLGSKFHLGWKFKIESNHKPNTTNKEKEGKEQAEQELYEASRKNIKYITNYFK